MSDLFSSLVRRSSGSTDFVRPRVPALFEPLQSAGSLGASGTFPAREQDLPSIAANPEDGNVEMPGPEQSSPVGSLNYLSSLIGRATKPGLWVAQQGARAGGAKFQTSSRSASEINVLPGTRFAPPADEDSILSLGDSRAPAESVVEQYAAARGVISGKDVPQKAKASGSPQSFFPSRMRSATMPSPPAFLSRTESNEAVDVPEKANIRATTVLPEKGSEPKRLKPLWRALLAESDNASLSIPSVVPTRAAMREGSSSSAETYLRREPPEPVVHVTIGRVEVRAVLPPAAKAKERSTPAVMSLDEYLHQRSRRGKQ